MKVLWGRFCVGKCILAPGILGVSAEVGCMDGGCRYIRKEQKHDTVSTRACSGRKFLCTLVPVVPAAGAHMGGGDSRGAHQVSRQRRQAPLCQGLPQVHSVLLPHYSTGHHMLETYPFELGRLAHITSCTQTGKTTCKHEHNACKSIMNMRWLLSSKCDF